VVFLNLGKTVFKNENGEIHFCTSPPKGFTAASLEDVKKAVENRGQKKFWRCHVCSDLHLGEKPPEICPTCANIDAYSEINEKEFFTVIGK